MTIKTYRLPPRFWWDHHERELPEQGHSERVAETSRHVQVAMDAPAYDDLLGDARHYAGISDYDLGLRASARATVTALTRQGPP